MKCRKGCRKNGSDLKTSYLKASTQDDWTDLFKQYYPHGLSIAMKFLSDPTLAEDAFQSALYHIYRSRDNFRGDSSFNSYAYAIIRNEARMMVRRAKKHKALELMEQSEEMLKLIVFNSSSPHDILLAKETLNVLKKRLRRKTFTMLSLVGAGYINEEVGRKLHLTLPATKSRVFRAREAGLKILQKTGS